MKPRTVVEIHPGEEQDSYMIWLYEPSQLAQAAMVRRFPYGAGDAVPRSFAGGVGTVDQMGAYLMNALSQHPAIDRALQNLLDAAPGTTQPLLIRISPEAENLPWETVFANGTFLALDQRWPIARMSQQDGKTVTERDFQPPLQMMLILAADGVDATAEWDGILASLQTAPFPVAVRALVAQAGLRDRIAATNVPNVSVSAEMVPEGRDLIDLIRDAQPSPNVLHFFCHGTVVNGTPYLQIGTALSGIDAGNAVMLTASDIPVQALGDSLWLVTLNCCRGAQGPEAAASLVFSLMRAEVPAVAGMRLPVSDTDANVFSRSFYRTLMRLLAPAVRPDAVVELDWTQTLYDVRMALCEAHRTAATYAQEAKSSREWTLPVLYLTPRPFVLRGRAASAAPVRDEVLFWERGPISPRPGAPALTDDERTAAETELQLLRSLVSLGLGAPQQALQAYQERINDLERQLYGPQ
jgi:CHAT domain